MSEFPKSKTQEEWRAILAPERFSILREAATERPFSGELNHVEGSGEFTCAGCGELLFSTDAKFDSGCGWPSFDAAAGTVIEREDRNHGMLRVEIICGGCGGHLGHVFNDGPTQTGLRYCVNSLAIDYDRQDS
jgi:peptide-methionine (R)-S-oxide reductase